MFPEYRDLITRLKTEGTHQRFLSLFEQHNQLDHEVAALESRNAGSTHLEIEKMKKQKLRLKDEIYAILRAEAENKA